jgi:hypothetical protein
LNTLMQGEDVPVSQWVEPARTSRLTIEAVVCPACLVGHHEACAQGIFIRQPLEGEIPP